jgi:hypothetical protein
MKISNTPRIGDTTVLEQWDGERWIETKQIWDGEQYVIATPAEINARWEAALNELFACGAVDWEFLPDGRIQIDVIDRPLREAIELAMKLPYRTRHLWMLLYSGANEVQHVLCQ